MPKKHHKAVFTKPASTAHHTLSSSSRRDQHDPFRSSNAAASPAPPSVNDLISHLRRTQVSQTAADNQRSPSRVIPARSVHPSLRNVLELPETPPPRPRPGSRRVGVGGRRRFAGPPPPESWLLGDSESGEYEACELDMDAQRERVIYRVDRLPGTTFPGKDTLLHILLKSMASQWLWHVEYDGQFLGTLPTHIRELLLSYIAVHARDLPLAKLTHGLRPLFNQTREDDLAGDWSTAPQNTDSEVSRLDLSCAIGRWMSFKQLTTELFVSVIQASMRQEKIEKHVPTSWEDEYDEAVKSTASASLPKTLGEGPRFRNLRFLSFAHPRPGAANWNSLITLLSRLSTITHLSLAHWPVPTVTPNATHARIRHPNHNSLTFSYSGTDSYASIDNNWAEAAGILRRLSRATYCLKWLDLEGCSSWIPALNWEGVGPDGEPYATGPEWNGSWRDVEFVRLGPGWLPHIDDSELSFVSGHDHGTGYSVSPVSSSSPARALAASIHAPASLGDPGSADLPWDVEVERIRYRRRKEVEIFKDAVQGAKAVQQRVFRVRRDDRGKWARFSFGLEGLDRDVLKRLLGPEYWRLLP
ncbi:hypothetical protein BJX96DRAFT_151428 [Aspergillus floccosus]